MTRPSTRAVLAAMATGAMSLSLITSPGATASAGTTASAGATASAGNTPGAGSAAGGGAWSATATGATNLRDATVVGPTPASTTVPVEVNLAVRDPADLAALIAAQADPQSASYHRYLSPAGFAARFGATPAQLAKVTAYLRRAGLSGVEVSTNHLTVSGHGGAAKVASAFHTSLRTFLQNGHSVLANTAPVLVPRSLGGLVSSVVGLNGARSLTSFDAGVKDSIVAGGAMSPPALARAYDANAVGPANASSIAVMVEGDLSQVVADLRREESIDHLPAVPVTIVRTGAASTDTSALDEWDLDVQASAAMAGNVKRIYLYDATRLTDLDMVDEIRSFVSQDVAQAGSISFGECDLQAFADGTAVALDAALAQAAVQGQSLFAATGDAGASCAVSPPGGLLGPSPETSYPASSTYATAVGGTSLATRGGTYVSESAWARSGGGVSAEPAGQWTRHATAAAIASTSSGVAGLFGLLGLVGSVPHAATRGVPDLAMDADPNTGANVVVDGTLETLGGTSLAAPLALGAWARVNAAHGNLLGDAAPALYRLYDTVHPGAGTGATPGLHDVTTGGNGSFPARPGYDLVTGLGTIDVAALAAAT